MNNCFGRSGSKIDLLYKDGNTIIRKISKHKRFEEQIKKQASFEDDCFFSKPKIYSFTEKDDKYICDMEFINSENPIYFISNSSKKELDVFSDKIIYFIRKQILLSRLQEVNIDIFLKKLKDIDVEDSLKSEILSYMKKKFKQEYFLIPTGSCHGDFTISNMLLSEKIYLIDFLDSFCESPIQDMVKIRQDTNYYWILNICNSGIFFKKEIAKENLKYIDSKISAYFETFDWYIQLYKLFQIFNLTRIIPYLKNEENVKIFLLNSIHELLSETS